ncbi:N-acetylglucosaminyl-phosphatidylinositol de-N-acetylase-like isoform X2 [Dioscorea cayenensis subsp. rotundata]|uniref:N-acetylglucosaminylphosphatidylinositol deacetylase n=1 Tax=Dioscorea cayennensis subsp. rotundata TaxID=55577 RepID=A0AB40C696_DIOCR|nr:N-acetylglucosaminyl-phosphatidylinositol de-N-acetylase-like isoform X2 [Dioscorea cayenensis subsp. rotundata]
MARAMRQTGDRPGRRSPPYSLVLMVLLMLSAALLVLLAVGVVSLPFRNGIGRGENWWTRMLSWKPRGFIYQNSLHHTISMSWLSITTTMVITLWVISLLRVLLASSPCIPSSPAFLSAGSSATKKRRNALLVVAHPDDESMFFAPTLLYLASEGHNVHVLCLSTGNADGKGNIRKEEFYRACAILKVPLQQVQILDHPKLHDGFDKPWDIQLLAKIVKEEIRMRAIDLVITFDNYGVSGHPNHRDVHRGICVFLCDNSGSNVEAWELASTSIFRKYTGPVDIWLSIFFSHSYPGSRIYCLLNKCPSRSYLAMAEHSSQWVWLRKLFVVFSSYTYINTLRKVNF